MLGHQNKNNIWAVAVVLCALLLSTRSAAEPEIEELLLAVSLNGQRMTQGTLIARSSDGLWVRRDDLQAWRLIVPTGESLSWGGEELYPLHALAGVSYRIDDVEQLLLIEAPAAAFSLTRIDARRGVFTKPMPSPLGGFFNYDVFATHDETRSAVNALAEIGVFNGFGVATSNFVRRDFPEGARTIRLETTWTDDRPEDMVSARAGDLISGAGAWGRAVRFGGVQRATNFATQPGFISLSRPAMQGEAALPSTLELYVNDMLRLKRDVPAGPFSIQDMPVVTGQGEARLVVTDLLGREQIIVAPYYASPRLLDAGLNAYSYELGAIREDYGLVSNRYGRAMAVGTFRRGMSSHWTAELHAEFLEEQQTAGLGSVWLWPAVGVFSAAIAGSRSDALNDGTQMRLGGTGSLVNVGFQSQHRRIGYGATAQWSSAEFAQVGLERGRPAPRLVAQAFVNVSAGRAGAVSVSYSYQDPRDTERTEFINANYGVTLGRIGFLSVSLVRVLGSAPESLASLNFTRLLGSRDTGSLFISRDADDTRASMRLQRGLPQGEGFGYRMVSGFSDTDAREAAVAYQNDIGTYEVGVGQIEEATSYRAHASGGVAFLGTEAFFSRRVDSSFAVVTVPGYEGVQVYRDNQPVARTNDEGVALVSRLRPYEINSVRIESTDLPMDATIDKLQLDAIPYLRSGLRLAFPVRRSRGALFNIVLENGEPLPAGAVVTIGGRNEEFPVGLRGEVYVTGLEASNQLAVTWGQRRCALNVSFPESDDPLPHLGIFECGGVEQ